MRQLRSAQVTQGVERAPARSLFYAMGYTKEELDRPLIGVVSAHSEIVPGHFNLDKITEAVKLPLSTQSIQMIGGCMSSVGYVYFFQLFTKSMKKRNIKVITISLQEE